MTPEERKMVEDFIKGCVVDEEVLGVVLQGMLDRLDELEPTPILIRGKRYSSPKVAAAALGVKTNTIYVALRNGREDYVGIGKGNNRWGQADAV